VYSFHIRPSGIETVHSKYIRDREPKDASRAAIWPIGSVSRDVFLMESIPSISVPRATFAVIAALFLAAIAVLPLAMRYFTGVQSLAIGGTSLLIVVSVVIETVKQIESQLTMREYTIE
jgi:hypothetical protein